MKLEEKSDKIGSEVEWGKVSAVLFDMDGVLCNSEEPSRRAAVDVFAEMGVQVTTEDFVPFTGTGKSPIFHLFFSQVLMVLLVTFLYCICELIRGNLFFYVFYVCTNGLKCVLYIFVYCMGL